MNRILFLLHFIVIKIGSVYRKILQLYKKSKLGYCGKNVVIDYSIQSTKFRNIYLFDNTNIFGNSLFLIVTGKFIMKKNSGAAQGLTVVTGNHTSRPGILFKELTHKEDIEKDVVVEEDVWIGANVTLLAGVVVGRGSIVGAGSVCRKSIPPYAIVMGNPAKIVGFKFPPEEVIAHEALLYSEEERLPINLLEKNYDKYYITRMKEIKEYLK